jgi:hypothetical protein
MRRAAASSRRSRQDKVVDPEFDGPAPQRPREWLALPGGGIRQVISYPVEDGPAELLSHAAWLARLRPTCACGRPRLGSGRTCGGVECVARLREQ